MRSVQHDNGERLGNSFNGLCRSWPLFPVQGFPDN
jgi:hypothetical protein